MLLFHRLLALEPVPERYRVFCPGFRAARSIIDMNGVAVGRLPFKSCRALRGHGLPPSHRGSIGGIPEQEPGDDDQDSNERSLHFTSPFGAQDGAAAA